MLAAMGVLAVRIIKYAAPYHPTSSRAWNWLEILGVATEIMVVSRDMRVVPSMRDAMIMTSLRPVGYCDTLCLAAVGNESAVPATGSALLMAVSSITLMEDVMVDQSEGRQRVRQKAMN